MYIYMKIKIYRHCLSGNYIRQTFGDHHLQGYCRYSCVPGIVQKKGPSEDQRSPIPAQTTVLVSGFKIWEFRVWCNRGLIQSKDSKVCSFVAKYWMFWARTIRSSVSNIAFGALVHQGGGGAKNCLIPKRTQGAQGGTSIWALFFISLVGT